MKHGSPPPPAQPADGPAAPGHASPIHSHCENCGTRLEGPYCHHCGQHDFDFHRSFGHVLMEALENFLHFDAKFFRDIVTLLFRPGRLSAEFNAGKRASQMPPFRLYLFVSFLFFLLGYITSDHRPAREGEVGDTALAGAALDAMARTDPKAPRDVRLHEVAASLRRLKEEAAAERNTGAPGSPESRGLHITVKEDNSNAFSRYLSEKGRYAVAHQSEAREAFLHSLPRMLLFCLPLFALWTRLLFVRAGASYLHHLIIALHFHTFIYLWLVVAGGWLDLARLPAPALAGWLSTASWAWMLVYPLLMFRRLTGESWGRTTVKSAVLAVCYGLTLAAGFLITLLVVVSLL